AGGVAGSGAAGFSGPYYRRRSDRPDHENLARYFLRPGKPRAGGSAGAVDAGGRVPVGGGFTPRRSNHAAARRPGTGTHSSRRARHAFPVRRASCALALASQATRPPRHAAGSGRGGGRDLRRVGGTGNASGGAAGRKRPDTATGSDGAGNR